MKIRVMEGKKGNREKWEWREKERRKNEFI